MAATHSMTTAIRGCWIKRKPRHVRASFLYQSLRALAELREDALKGAIAGGHLKAVESLVIRRWEPVNFIPSARCVEEALVSGVAGSQVVNFSEQLFALFRALSTNQYPIEIEEPDPSQLLHDVAINHKQGIDVVEYLLDYGASVQKVEPFNRAPSPRSFYEIYPPWNAL